MDSSAFRGFGGAIAVLLWCALAGAIAIFIVIPSLLLRWWYEPDREQEAIDKGFGLHCPDTGEFAWKGECNEQEKDVGKTDQ